MLYYCYKTYLSTALFILSSILFYLLISLVVLGYTGAAAANYDSKSTTILFIYIGGPLGFTNKGQFLGHQSKQEFASGVIKFY